MIRKCSNARPERLSHLGEAPFMLVSFANNGERVLTHFSLSDHALVIIVTYNACVQR